MISMKFGLSLFITSLAVVLVGAAGSESLAADDENEETVIEKHRIVVRHCDPESEDCDEDQHDYTFMLHGGGQGGFLGVHLTGMTPELRAHFGVDEDRGVMVSKVSDDSPAFRAGIEPGDIITAAAGATVSSRRDLFRAIMARSEGEAIDLEIWRDGGSEIVTTILDQRSSTLPQHHAFHSDCEDSDGDCGVKISRIHRIDTELGCGDEKHCEVQILCGEDDECTCTSNGEVIDCQQIAGFRSLHH